MSNKKRRNQDKSLLRKAAPGLPETGGSQIITEETTQPAETEKAGLFAYLKAHWWLTLIITFLSIGALGAGLKYLETDAKREFAMRENNKGRLTDEEKQSALSGVNPSLPAALPNPTPQLSKEYIYAGGKLLAVEDVNANAAPPADLAVWRSSTGEWWVMGSTGGSQQTTQAWGTSEDKPVPGDYDGDGKTDFSVFRPSNGNWYIVYSSGGSAQYPFGTVGDHTAQADYDGDGKTDAAVFRAGTWYILRSSDFGVTTQAFGLATDVPAAADYDGDGRADIAIRRGGDTTFYVLRSSNSSLQTITLGQSADLAVSADYDGDGKADAALFRDSTATWYIYQSSNNQLVSYQWGASGDKLVQNDYDADGKADVAVWRNSNGNWYIRNSSTGALRQVQWGIPGDTPVPALYRR